MASTLRAFFAAEIPDALRGAIAERTAELAQALHCGVRWTDPEHYHLTLKFLGEIDEHRIPRLLRAAASKLARSEPFEVSIGGWGGFPSARAARVAWVGIASGSAPLARLARKLDTAAAKIDVPRDRRPYSAHITIGRLREPAALPLDAIGKPLEGSFRVQRVVLFESQLGPSGAQHRACARLGLPPDESELNEFPELAPER